MRYSTPQKIRTIAMWCGFVLFTSMSIAISTSLRPSPILQAIQYGLLLLLVATAATLFFMPDIAAQLRYSLVAVCLCAVGFAAWWQQKQKIHYQITISHEGNIYLSRITTDGTAISSASELVSLVAGSTIWPSFMLLRLRNEAGRIYPLALMPDSTSADNFRALAVAVRWIIRRKTKS